MEICALKYAHCTNCQPFGAVVVVVAVAAALLLLHLLLYGHVSLSSGLAKTILQGTVKGGRRQGRQRKRWEDNIREMTGLKFGKS